MRSMRMKRRLTVYLVMVLCLVCAGARADCTHPNAYQSSRRENVEYESTGDLKEHKISYDLYQYMYCPNCGTRFSETSLGRQFDSGNHYWNSENTCLYCNQTNACKHSEEHVWFTERNYQYAQTGDTKTHSVTYDWYQITDCALCGLRLSESLVTTKTKDGNHNWNDSGICWSCGQTNACVHEKQNVWFTSKNYQYQQTGDEEKHRLTYDWYKMVDCLQCGMRLSETLVDTKTVDSSHNWNKYGICHGCGQTNTCVHDKTHIGNETQNYRYEQIGDATKHRVTYDWYQVTYCTLCKQRLSTSGVETKTEIQSHNWNETGICWSCGQENGCSHSETTVENETRDYRYEQIGDAKNHRATYDQYKITKCKLCGQRISEIYAETKTEHQSHFWNNAGICSGCGQENACAHGKTSSRTTNRNHQYQQTGDVKTHQVTYDRYRITECSLCGLRLSEDYLKTVTENWDHIWNEAGICSVCGQENACAHGKTSSWTTSRNYQYRQTGDLKNHQVTYDRYEITDCALCGLCLSEDYVATITDDWSHSWNDEGICRDCGQKNVCAHESVVESAYSTDHQYTKIDTNTHLLAFTVKIRRRCSVCNQTLDERMGGQYEVEQRHSWSSDGICWNCGEINTCEHTNTREDLYSHSGYDYTDTGDGLHHNVKEVITFYKDCVDCGLRIDGRKETNEYTEEHAEKYGCWKCDYKAECPHEGTRYEAVDWIDMRYSVINKRRHALYGRTETRVYCSDCDEELSATQSEAEELLNTEKHSWNNEGICYECGFKNPCTHGNTDVRLMSVDRFYVARNDATHTQTVIYREVTCCADCGVTLGEISSLKKVVQTEAHAFDNGRCWACGFINRCSHDGTTHTGTEFGDWWDTVCIDDKTHKVDREILSTVYCDLCGEIVSQESLGRQWIVQEHEMYEDRCEHCDYRVACAHEATVKKLLPDSDYLFCESISDNAHAATCRLVAYECCESCGVLLEGRTVGTTKVNEPHNIINHRCVECGYCEHPAEQIETTRDYIPSERQYEKYNEYTHLYYWGSSLYTSVCRLCGDTVKEWSEEGGTSVGTHNYGDGGVCRYCGYVNTCRHDNAYRASEMQHYAYVDIGDDEQHESVSRERTFMFCPDCLYRWDDQPGTAEDVRLVNHYYTRVGKCKLCGHKNPCEHKNTELIRQEFSQGLGNNSCYSEFINEDYHAVYCTDRYEHEKCLDCGLKLSGKYVECEPVLVMAKEEHQFDDSGKCWCGYVNPHPCEHLNTVTHIRGGIGYHLQCDDTHHKRVRLGRVGVYCADCGKEITATSQIAELVTYQEHSFNKQGVCQVCYHVKKCKHLETQINRYCGIYGCSIIDDTCHEIHHVIEEVELCLSCGMAIKGEKLEESIDQQPHDGEDACTICGWRNPEHVCVWELHDYRDVLSAKAIDALRHEAVIQRKAYQYCRGCGDEGSEKILPVEKVVESHHFTDMGRCEDCGYVNFCKHKETYEKQILEPISGRTAKDEFEHTLIADVTTETRCKFCNQRLSFTAALNVECTEEHVFDSVADLVCDLCGYEREAPEEAATPEPTPTTTPEPTNTPAPTKKPGGGNTGSGSSGDTTPSKPKDTATPTPEEALPKTGDESMPMGILLMVMVISICALDLMTKRKYN